jgi:hypothetical protein
VDSSSKVIFTAFFAMNPTMKRPDEEHSRTDGTFFSELAQTSPHFGFPKLPVRL